MATMAQMATVVARAHPATTEDRQILVEASEILSGQKAPQSGEGRRDARSLISEHDPELA